MAIDGALGAAVVDLETGMCLRSAGGGDDLDIELAVAGTTEVARAKAQPGKLTYGTPGSGSLPHVAFELLKLRTGLDILHVPYRGGGPAAADLAAGNIDLMISSPLDMAANLQSGRAVPVAAASATFCAAGLLVPDISGPPPPHAVSSAVSPTIASRMPVSNQNGTSSSRSSGKPPPKLPPAARSKPPGAPPGRPPP